MSKILIALEIYLNVYKYVIFNILTPIHFIFLNYLVFTGYNLLD